MDRIYYKYNKWIIEPVKSLKFLDENTVKTEYTERAGRCGLLVPCLTVVCEISGLNPTMGSCVYRENHCDM